MAHEAFVGIFAVMALFVGLPWVILHYITKWKTTASLTNEDEHLLEELYVMAKRLDERMDSIERIVKADNPEWQPDRLTSALRREDREAASIRTNRERIR